MLTGSCLCSAVQYEVQEPLESLSHCHCSICRKIHGTPFASYTRSAEVVVKKGAENIARYESSPGFERCFCDLCGSVLPEKLESENYWFVPAGGLDGKLDIKPVKHIFAGSKAPWYDIPDDLPQMLKYSEEQGTVKPDNHASEVSNEDKEHVSGSCLCGKVTFNYKHGTAKLMMLCHCSRCRKVKGAAHAANVFVAPDDFEWLSGKDHTTVYDLPDAERFGNSFCNTCGSSVPRQSENSPMLNIPAGSLDDAPGIEPKAHIYIASKADWFDIADQTPQHDEMP